MGAVLPELAGHYPAIAPDLLGHGESDKPRHDYSLGVYAEHAARPHGRPRDRAGDRRRPPLVGRRDRHPLAGSTRPPRAVGARVQRVARAGHLWMLLVLACPAPSPTPPIIPFAARDAGNVHHAQACAVWAVTVPVSRRRAIRCAPTAPDTGGMPSLYAALGHRPEWPIRQRPRPAVPGVAAADVGPAGGGGGTGSSRWTTPAPPTTPSPAAGS